jgi:hypothetical protein
MYNDHAHRTEAFPALVTESDLAGGVVFLSLGSSYTVGPAFTGGEEYDEELAAASAAGYQSPTPGGV